MGGGVVDDAAVVQLDFAAFQIAVAEFVGDADGGWDAGDDTVGEGGLGEECEGKL